MKLTERLMRISTWRSALATFLGSKLNITSFDLRQPIDYDEVLCYLPPLAGIGFATGDISMARAVQDIVITKRYRADTLYIDLPLGDMEGLISSMHILFTQGFKSISEVMDLTVMSVANPVTVTEYGDGLGDWLVTVALAVEIMWIPELETLLVPEAPIPIVSINTGLFTEHLEPKPPLLTVPESHTDVTNRDKYAAFTINKRQP